MRSILRHATAMALLFNAGVFVPAHRVGDGYAALEHTAASVPATPTPAPQNANDVIALFNNILSQACRASYTRGRQLGTGWQQQVVVEGPGKYASDLIAFRDSSASCLAQIGAVITATGQQYSDITSEVVGSWSFAPGLWIATNSFAATIADNTTPAIPDRIAKATTPAQQFSAGLDGFSQWITVTGNRLAQIQKQKNAPQQQ